VFICIGLWTDSNSLYDHTSSEGGQWLVYSYVGTIVDHEKCPAGYEQYFLLMSNYLAYYFSQICCWFLFCLFEC
jgi:hypothetical protein